MKKKKIPPLEKQGQNLKIKDKRTELAEALENFMRPADDLNKEQAVAEGIKKMTDPQAAEILTDLSDTEIAYLAGIAALNEIATDPVVEKLYEKIVLLKVSKNRKSREEIVDITKPREDETHEQKGFIRRFIG